MVFELTFLFLLAFIAAALLVRARRRGPGPVAGLWSFFLLFLLVGWACSLWIVPAGPVVYDVYWTGPLVGTLLLALILLAVIPASGRRPQVDREELKRIGRETPDETGTRHAIEMGISVFFWVAVLGLIFVIAVSYALT